MGIFSRRWLVRGNRGEPMVLIVSRGQLELRHAGFGGGVEFSYEDPRAEFAEAWANKDFYVRGGQRKRVTRARIYDLQKAGGTRVLEFRNTADGDSFRRWLERREQK
ncbi:hypothetical protein [Adlercreutzia mucosicola]|uniref:hypothetical protein n=1 Tax=Adlercreutzia mucosicola TaxID=580026 RepID=UPI000407F242|nr:hypothetical protein [Adlercreutzia mucosicola]MCR2034112.1 hypothetical protein [Adlercreutzia mucosicola]